MTSERTLGEAETRLAKCAIIDGGWRFGAILSITGPGANNIEKLNEVLSKLQRRHPILRKRIYFVGKGEAFTWKNDDEYRVPVKFESKDPRKAYLEASNDKLKSGDGVFRVNVVCVNNQSATLIPLIEHFAADGMSYTNLLNELLLGLSGSVEFDRLVLNELPLSLSCEALSESSYKGSFVHKLCTVARLRWDCFRTKISINRLTKLEVADEQRQMLLCSYFSPDESRKLRSSCRSHNTTITALLGAVFSEVYALLLHQRSAALESINENEQIKCKVSQTVAIDLRRRYSPIMEREHLSFHVGLGTPIIQECIVPTPLKKTIWDTACEFKAHLNDDDKRQLVLLTGPVINNWFDHSRKFGDVFLTNWGVLPISRSYGSLQVTKFVGGINTLSLSFPVWIVWTFEGSLGVSLQASREKFDKVALMKYFKTSLEVIENLLKTE